MEGIAGLTCPPSIWWVGQFTHKPLPCRGRHTRALSTTRRAVGALRS